MLCSALAISIIGTVSRIYNDFANYKSRRVITLSSENGKLHMFVLSLFWKFHCILSRYFREKRETVPRSLPKTLLTLGEVSLHLNLAWFRRYPIMPRRPVISAFRVSRLNVQTFFATPFCPEPPCMIHGGAVSGLPLFKTFCRPSWNAITGRTFSDSSRDPVPSMPQNHLKV